MSVAAAYDRTFTVRDSIEMSRFLRYDPNNEQIAYSPNARWFAVVTSRGVIQSDAIESTIWVFSMDAVRQYLESGKTISQNMTPRALARLSFAVAPAYYPNSYEPVIENLHWLPDSSALVFQGGGVGARRLYRVAFPSGDLRTLTPGGGDVAAFGWTQNAIVYSLGEPYHRAPVGEPINADAADITGLDIEAALFPQESFWDTAPRELWAIRGGRARRLAGNDPAHPLELPSQILDLLAVAPDGHAAVALFAATTVPLSWATFEPNPTLPYLRIDPRNPNVTLASNPYRPMQYGLVDTRSGRDELLINAPTGSNLGSYDAESAVWSRNARKVILTDTFLPVDGAPASQQGQRRYPCRAAIVDVESSEQSCVLFSSYDYAKGKGWILSSASFGQGDNDVNLFMEHIPDGKGRFDRYRFESGTWTFVGSTPKSEKLQSSRTIAITAKEEVNEPPALWATDVKSKATKKLWDPNPQLGSINLGQALVWRFTDPSGHEWTSGLVKPPDYVKGRRYPLIIQTHGFDEHEFLTDGAYTTAFAARPLAAAGFVVLQMNDNGEHVVSLREADDQIRGYKTAISKLNAQGLIDPERIGIIGFSRTCYYVESALIKNPELFTAASITDGVDESYIQSMFFGVLDEPRRMYGGPPIGKNLPAWLKWAPSFNLDRVRAPLLINTIGNGSVLGEWEIYSSLRIQKKPVELTYLPQGQHILQRPLERLASQQGSVDWFRFWLQGYEDPDPSKAAQYKRWEALKTLHPK
jgi:dipeptidyl aminopeptidase/acylaminoacyl peptidase